MTQSLTDVLADLILAENLIAGIGEAESSPTTRKRELARDAKRALPAIAKAIVYLTQLKIKRDSTHGAETGNKTDKILRDDTAT